MAVNKFVAKILLIYTQKEKKYIFKISDERTDVR